MKRKFGISLILAALALAGCSEKQASAEKERRQMFQIDSVDARTGVQRMQMSKHRSVVTCGKEKLDLEIVRRPDEKLPVVHSSNGNFMDNSIGLLLKKEGRVLVNRVFTKKDFTRLLPYKGLEHFMLEGLVFDDISTREKKELTFSASISYPQSDLYIPFRIVVSQQGKVNIHQDESMGEFSLPTE